MSDERCAGRFWWQEHFQLTGKTNPPCDVVIKSINHIHPMTVWEEALRNENDHGSMLNRRAVAACVAYQEYRNANPGLSARELLGLPEEKPEPAKLMTKAQIAATIRDWAEIRERGDGVTSRHVLSIADAVEALPDPVKPSPFALKVAAELPSRRICGRNKLAATLLNDFRSAMENILEDLEGDNKRRDALLYYLIRLGATCQNIAEGCCDVPSGHEDRLHA